jgi:hypothetical protein
MERLLIVLWYCYVLAAGEYTIWGINRPDRRGLLLFTLLSMLFGHPLWWLLVGLGGIASLINIATGNGAVDPVFAAVCAFTGLSMIAYMAFRFMPQLDRRLRS